MLRGRNLVESSGVKTLQRRNAGIEPWRHLSFEGGSEDTAAEMLAFGLTISQRGIAMSITMLPHYFIM